MKGRSGAVAEKKLAGHLERIPGWREKWALWNCVGLRGAGFAAESVLRLGNEESAQAADELLEEESKALQAWELALAAVNDAFNALPWNEEGFCHDKRVHTLFKARRSLKRGKQPQLDEEETTEGKAIREFGEANARVEAAHARFVRSFEAAQAEASQVIREVATDDRFREAVTWQNRRALHNGIDSLLRSSVNTTSSKQRSSEELIASYMQRYCTKNDNIGFFGPMGWARLDAGCPDVSVRPGPSLLASRDVYFECWCVDALCNRLAEDEGLRPWFLPRRLPFVRLEDTLLHLPLQEPRRLSAGQALVLAACDGDRTAKSIASDLIRSSSEIFSSEQEVYQLLAQLEQMRLIVWKLEVPDSPRAERQLRELLEQVTDNEAREQALEVLGKLEQARREVAQAAGNAQQLEKALAEMEDFFTVETKRAATRLAGQVYAARTLLYEDCRRDLEVKIGREMMERLGCVLGLLLQSARWMVAKIGEEYRRKLHSLYLQLVKSGGETAVDAGIFWLHAEPLLGGAQSELIEEVAKRFQEKWARLLPVDWSARHVRFSSQRLRGLVETEFAAAKPGWQLARYHSPDVMIAAKSVEAIRRGDYEFVLGELHVAQNTFGGMGGLMQHPKPEELYRAFDIDMSLPGVIPVYPKDEQHSIRIKPALESPKDFYLEHSGGAPGVPAARALTTATLVVESTGADLYLRTRDHRVKFDIIEFFGRILSSMVVDKFKLFKPREHMPRVSIDRLVVQRESWSLPASSATFAFERLDADRFLEARRFAGEYQMPRHVFVKVPVEPKPVYVDFASGIYVNLLGKLIRRSVGDTEEARVVFSEMLPGLGETWLPDAEGRRYTSEFRFVALDLA